MPLPIPRLAPVMSATFPVNLNVPSYLSTFDHICAVHADVGLKLNVTIFPFECDCLQLRYGAHALRPRGRLQTDTNAIDAVELLQARDQMHQVDAFSASRAAHAVRNFDIWRRV